jgi:hypothetical protein
MGQNSHQIAIKDAKRKAVFEALQVWTKADNFHNMIETWSERADKKQILYSRV